MNFVAMQFYTIEVPYASLGGARLVWRGVDEDDEQVVVLTDEELRQLVEILKKQHWKNRAGGPGEYSID